MTQQGEILQQIRISIWNALITIHGLIFSVFSAYLLTASQIENRIWAILILGLSFISLISMLISYIVLKSAIASDEKVSQKKSAVLVFEKLAIGLLIIEGVLLFIALFI